MPAKPKKKSVSSENSPEYVRMFYEHQYESMYKMEDQRLVATNIIFSVSLLALAYGFNTILNIITGVAIPIIIITANIFAILYINSSRAYARIHRKRAKETLSRYAPYLVEIDEKYSEHSERKFLSQGQFQLYLHALLIIAAMIPIVTYLSVW